MNTRLLTAFCTLALIISPASKTYGWGSPPVADLSVDRYVCVGSSVAFNACFSEDPDACPYGCTGCPLTTCGSCGVTQLRNGITMYCWNFGDGTPVYCESPGDATAYHAYESAGTYTVTLTVWDHDLCAGRGPDKSGSCTRLVSAVRVDKIHVMPLPVADWFDVTGTTIVVLKGAIYRFKALPYPPDAGWPSGTPVWSGIVSGSGETIDVTFNNVGTEFLVAGCRPTPERTVTINEVVLEPDEVSFLDFYGGDEHDIYGVSDPVWKRVSNPDNPACYTKYKFIKVGGKFWASENLTYSTKIYVDLQDQSTGWTFLSNEITVKNWPSARSDHRSTERLADQIAAQEYTFKWRYKVPPPGANTWIDMANTSGPHKVYAVYGPPVCGSSNYTKTNLAEAVSKALGENTQSGIASKANDNVADSVFSGCICNDGFQKNFDAAMGRYPSSGDKGMCCCRAEGLDCVLNVLGIGPYTHDYVNEKPEPNPTKSIYVSHCSICGRDVKRNYWDSFWNNWEGVVKAGGSGSTCYAPASGRIAIDEGTYTQIDNRIGIDCGYYWRWGETSSDICPHLGPPA